MTIIPMWVLLPKTQFDPICATKLRTSRSCHPEMETLIPMPLKASFCLKMASTLTLGFQTRCEEAWLDPKNIPKTPNLRRYDRKTRATSNTHTHKSNNFEGFWSFLILWFGSTVPFNRRLAPRGGSFCGWLCPGEHCAGNATRDRTSAWKEWEGTQFINSSAMVR